MLAEVHAAAGTGSSGELLRREGLYFVYGDALAKGTGYSCTKHVLASARTRTSTYLIDSREQEAEPTESAVAGLTAQSRN